MKEWIGLLKSVLGPLLSFVPLLKAVLSLLIGSKPMSFM